MNNNNLKQSLVERVLNKVQSGQVKMRPKIYFVLRVVLMVLGVITVALFALFLISFISFALGISGVWSMPGFGLRGLGAFFVSMPWLLILMALLLILVLEILVKHFAFAYRRPIIYSVLAILLIVFLGSFIINRTQFHPDLFQRAQEGRLPVAGEFYRDFSLPKTEDVHHGMVSEVTDEGFSVETNEGEVLTTVITSETRFPFGTGIQEGDAVMILGQRDNDKVQAFGVSKIKDNFNVFRKNRLLNPRNMLIPHRTPILPSR